MYKEFLIILNNDLLVDFELLCISLNYPYKKIYENNYCKVFIHENYYKKLYIDLNELLRENLFPQEETIVIPFVNDKCSFFSWSIIIFLAIFFFFYNISRKKYLIINHGANDAYKVINGEFYRCITSLTIHGNFSHLLSNLFFLVLLLKYIVKIFGEGIAWFMIIISGFLGNVFTSFFYQNFHSSIGFSTSNFAMIGILANVNIKVLKSYLPAIAGFFLFIMLGGGKNVDVVAHICGFFSGLIVTEIFLKRFRFLIEKKYQNIFKLSVTFIILISWILAIIFN